MKLVLVIASLSSGGAERVITTLANYWVSKGHDVFLVTLSGKEDAPFYPLDQSVRLVRLGVMSLGDENWVKRLRSIVNRVYRLRQMIKKIHPDRVLSFVDITNLTTLLACLRLDIPVIVSERIDPHYHKIPFFYCWLRRFLYLLAQTVVVQTVSAARYFSLPTIIIPNFVRSAQSSAKIRDEVLNIISVGRLSPQKDFQTLIKAFGRLHSEHSNLRLTIYGDGPQRCALKSLIHKSNLSDCVFLPGAVSSIEEKMLEADLFVFPSLYEGFPNALCEAMATGLPVIASNCTGNRDVVINNVNGGLFPVGDIEVLASLIADLISDRQKRESMSGQGKKIVIELSLEKILKLWDDTVVDLH